MIATCPERTLLRNYVNGMVTDAQADELNVHLQDCDDCRSWLNEATDLDDTMVGQLRQCSTVDESFDLEPQCQQAMTRALAALAGAMDAQEEGEDLTLPQAIGDYKIVRRIGSGGMGSVYLAEHTKLNRSVAVKVLARHRIADTRMHDRFEMEMRAVGSLSHANIVTAHDAREVDGIALLVTEWIDGLDLKEILRRVGPLSVADACEVGVRITEALKYIDQQQLVHRDLKPSNVMINREGEVKVLDLGLARLRSAESNVDVTGSGQGMGTADYVAPEQISDARAVDIRADMYALGCTLYKLLSGRAPFEDKDHSAEFAKLTAHVSETPLPIRELVPNLPPGVANLVDRLLAKSPDERPKSVEEITRVLAQSADTSDLNSLIRTAIAMRPSINAAAEESPVRESPQPFMRKKVPASVAIASGVIGTLIGCVLGVVITIKHRDGTQTQIRTDSVSEITIGDEPATGNENDVESSVSPQIPNPFTAASPNNDVLAPPNDVPLLDGVWIVRTGMYRGIDAPFSNAEGLCIVFHGDRFVAMQKSRAVMRGTYEIDSDLARIELRNSAADQPETFKGMYRLQSNGMLELFLTTSDEFPRAFGLGRSTSSTLTLLKFNPADTYAASNDAPRYAFDMYEALRSDASEDGPQDTDPNADAASRR